MGKLDKKTPKVKGPKPKQKTSKYSAPIKFVRAQPPPNPPKKKNGNPLKKAAIVPPKVAAPVTPEKAAPVPAQASKSTNGKVEKFVPAKKLNKKNVKEALQESENFVKAVKGKGKRKNKVLEPEPEPVQEESESEEEEEEPVEAMDSDEEEQVQENDSSVEENDSDDEVTEEPIRKSNKMEVEEESDDDDDDVVEKPIKKNYEDTDEISLADIPRSIFVGNCHLSTQKTDLIDLFEKFGSVKSVILNFKEFNGRKVGLKAYIVFKDAKSATKAFKAENLKLNEHELFTGPVKWSALEKLSNQLVFIGNMSSKTTQSDIEKLFVDAGEIALIDIVPKNDRAHAFVCFKEPDSVELALKLNGTNLDGRKLFINTRLSKEDKAKESIFVTHLPQDVTDDILKEFFAECGEVSQINFGHGKTTAIVIFKQSEAVEKALALDGHKINDHSIFIKKYKVQDFKTISVVVRNLESSVNQNTIRKHFSNCGDIALVNMFKGDVIKKSHAIIRFKHKRSVILAMKLNKSKLNGNIIFVKQLDVQAGQKGSDKNHIKQKKQNNKFEKIRDIK